MSGMPIIESSGTARRENARPDEQHRDDHQAERDHAADGDAEQRIGLRGGREQHQLPAHGERRHQRQQEAAPLGRPAVLVAVARGSREASTTPASAATIPADCTGEGRSPQARPASTGMAALVASTGAAMLIEPIVSAR